MVAGLVNPIYHHLPVKGVSSNPSINQPTNGNLGHLWSSICFFRVSIDKRVDMKNVNPGIKRNNN